ncbi:plancitoxin-1-like [Culicoides brevitarsis]|uniref:plancitoxin-1-like n=1 Tax=Culicoides brevitarsis TaxID=469753 RepID=UPI00307C5E4F
MFRFAITLFCLVFVSSASASIGCRDENNKIVDFTYLYKLPDDPPAQTVFKSDGFRYAFMTSSSLNGIWIDSSRNITQKDSIPGLTLTQMYGNAKILAILYNDQSPSENDDSSKGHSKGVIVSDGTQGFWIVHSIPRFPPELEVGAYGYPSTGAKYGQNYLCVTMKAAEIDKAISQLEMNQVQIYSSQLPASLKKKFPNAVRLLEGFNVLTLKSAAGVTFTSFAKSSNFKRDLYQDLLAPAIGDISVESWKFGNNFLTSNCSTSQKVLTIASLDLEDVNYKFSTSRDHSKWAVSASNKANWICVGDINRFESQFKRGGGCLCQSSQAISEAYRKIIAETDKCE